MSPNRIVHTDKAPAAIGPYSQGIVANGFLFTAGQIALDPATGQVIAGNVGEQTERALRNLTAVLEAAGTTWGRRGTNTSSTRSASASMRRWRCG